MPYNSYHVINVHCLPNYLHVVCNVQFSYGWLIGKWECDEDDGIYYITSTGDVAAWFDYSVSKRYSWPHIFFAEIEHSGNFHTLRGIFSDIPVGYDSLCDKIICTIDLEHVIIRRISQNRNFMGKT
jgi:hypothetical protein